MIIPWRCPNSCYCVIFSPGDFLRIPDSKHMWKMRVSTFSDQHAGLSLYKVILHLKQLIPLCKKIWYHTHFGPLCAQAAPVRQEAQNACTENAHWRKRLQNDSLSCKHRKSKIMQPSHVFAHFWRSQALENRPKIDAKTFSKSALCWIPSWNPKKYDFWC